MKNKICIIGGSGFVGTRLLDILDRNYCYIIDKKESTNYNEITKIADIREKDTLLNSLDPETETIILLAAEHRDQAPPYLYYDTNVQGTKNVLECMGKMGINRIIFTSSVAIFGLNKINPDEKHAADPFRDYGNSKWQAEEILRKWQKEKPNDRFLTIVRPSVIFGEENRGNVYKLLKQISSGKFLMVGNGENKKSMAYIGNIAAFLKWCIRNNIPNYEIFIYTDNPDLSMNELLIQAEHTLKRKIPPVKIPYWLGMLVGYLFDLFTKLTRKKFSISSIRVEKFCATTQFNSNKAHSSGFKAPFSINDGLDITLKKEFSKL